MFIFTFTVYGRDEKKKILKAYLALTRMPFYNNRVCSVRGGIKHVSDVGCQGPVKMLSFNFAYWLCVIRLYLKNESVKQRLNSCKLFQRIWHKMTAVVASSQWP